MGGGVLRSTGGGVRLMTSFWRYSEQLGGTASPARIALNVLIETTGKGMPKKALQGAIGDLVI